MSAVVSADTAEQSAVAAVIDAGRFAASRGWTPATSGNFSARIDATRIAITRSGRDKGALVADDVARVALRPGAGSGSVLPDLRGLSAEAPLHFARYAADASIGVIVHVHLIEAALLSRQYADAGLDAIRLDGWELLKAFAGITTHDIEVHVPVFRNAQDTVSLADHVEHHLARWSQDVVAGRALAPGYVLAGHGLYAWGATLRDALRHLEAFDALFRLALARTAQGFKP